MVTLRPLLDHPSVGPHRRLLWLLIGIGLLSALTLILLWYSLQLI